MNVAKLSDSDLRWWCPGCDSNHVVSVGAGGWEFNGSLAAPTLSPSVLVHGTRATATAEWNRKHPRCHVFIREGRIEFLSDCEHELAGQTVPMGPVQ